MPCFGVPVGPPAGPFSLKSPASWGQAVARSRGHSCGGGPHRRPPFAERAPSTSQRATPLRTPGSESWCPTPSRDGHLIRAALVGIQPEVCRSATTGERRRAAINRGRWRDRSSLLPGRRLSITRSPGTTQQMVVTRSRDRRRRPTPHRGSISVQLRVCSVISRTVSGTRRHPAKARLCPAQSRLHRCHAAGPSGTVARVGVGSQAGMSRRAALQRRGQGEVRSAVRRQLANAALSSGRTTYSHGSGAALPARREAAYSHGLDAALPARSEMAYSHQGRAALPTRRETAYSHRGRAALPALREAAYSHGLDAALPARWEAAYSHQGRAALPARWEAAYSHGLDAALPAQREAAYSHRGRAALPTQREAAYSHGWDAALPARREAAYSHPKASEARTVQACRACWATMATPSRGMSALLQ